MRPPSRAAAPRPGSDSNPQRTAADRAALAAGLGALAEEIVRFRTASGAGRGGGAGVPAHRAAAPPRRARPIAGVPAAEPTPAETAAAARVPVQPRREAPSEPPAETPPPDHRDVLAIVARAQAGDAEAFGELYDRNVDVVYRYVYYRVGSVALAEDLVSETFLRALRRIDSFTYQGRDVAAWFITIARNLIADHFKSSRYRLELATEDMVGTAGERTAEDNPEAQVLDAMTNAVLVEAVKSLNPEQQECIVLRFLQGLSVTETALAMGKNEGAIKALQYRAVRALARKLPEGMTF